MRPGDRDHQGEIDAAVARVELLRPELDRACDAFLAAVIDWVPRWWEDRVRTAIADRPFVVTEDIGHGGLMALRRRLDELHAHVDNLVRLHVDDPMLWVHRRPLGQLLELADQGLAAYTRDYEMRNVTLAPIEERLRLVLGQLGPLLLNVRLASEYDVTRPEQRHGEWRRLSHDRPARYMGPLQVPPEVTAPLETYQQRAADMHAAVADVASAEHSKVRFLAEQMWDDV